jgi:hypothetical protein
MALLGRKVRCEIEFCNLRGIRCGRCPMLETGWAAGP